MTEQQNLILGRYRPIETRGTGGMGVVEIAWDTRIQRRVAIKRIPLDYRNGNIPGLSEARAAAMLQNPHIVQVIDFEATATEALLIMECIDGPTLAEILEDGPLDLDEIAAIAQAVSDALRCAHENQLLHLDIKPANILIDHDGNVKVTDFGIAELGGANGFSSASGGTIGYMPPEQMDQQEVDASTDQWAFAVVVYQMLTGENPFLAKTMAESLDLIENSEVVLPSALRDDIDEEIDDVVFRALSLEPEDRYKSVGAFQKALLPFLGNEERGRLSLRGIVDEIEDDEMERHQQTGHRAGSLRDLTKTYSVLDRILAALFNGWLAWLGASATTALLPFPLVLGIVVFIAALSALIPRWACLVTLVTVAASLFYLNLPWMSGIVLLIGVVWWLLFGRHFNEDAVLTIAGPALASIFLGFAAPLLTGYLLPWRRALATAVFGVLLTLICVALTGATVPYHCGFTALDSGASIWRGFIELIVEPRTWIVVLGWVLSAVLVSAICSLGKRVVSLLGTVLGIGVLIGALMVAGFVESGAWAISDKGALLPLILSSVVMCALVLVDAPDRIEWD